MLSFLFSLALFGAHQAPTHSFAAGENGWLMDGKPYVVRSGEMHYPRIPRAYWADRLRRAKALGLNTICTYVFWNFHETAPGKYDFSGDHDVAAFVREAQNQGLNVILRPGPYVCSEWDWGGFPYWLANIPGIQIRQNNPQFLAASGRWLDRLGKELAPLTVKHGGPIILCQVENEYGSFGADHAYMEAIHRQILHAGFDCQLYTADGSGHSMLEGGTLPDLPAAINFGGGAPGEFANLESFRPAGPRMNGEFWCGWFDHWGERHNTGSLTQEVKDLDWMLSKGYSVNLYMAHGGTSFGWMAGANSGGPNHYEPDTTSYDYDAPIAEDGTLTKKYWAFREVFKKHLNPGETLPDPPADNPHIAIPEFSTIEVADVLSQPHDPIHSEQPLSFEELYHPFGLVAYSTKLPNSGSLAFKDLQDRAWICGEDGEYGVVDRATGPKPVDVSGKSVTVVVEQLGRVNFSRALLKERVGFVQASLNGMALFGWDMKPIDLDHLDAFTYRQVGSWSKIPSPSPELLRASFQLIQVGDTYLQVGARPGHSGQVWVNGHNLGRWDPQGPQQTLYCPAPYLRIGRNEIVVLDMAGQRLAVIRGFKTPIFGP